MYSTSKQGKLDKIYIHIKRFIIIWPFIMIIYSWI